MINVVQRCALQLYQAEKPVLTKEILDEAIRKEQENEGKITY